jgi:hypothetical protein
LLFKEIYGKIYSLLGRILLRKSENWGVGNYKLRYASAPPKIGSNLRHYFTRTYTNIYKETETDFLIKIWVMTNEGTTN